MRNCWLIASIGHPGLLRASDEAELEAYEQKSKGEESEPEEESDADMYALSCRALRQRQSQPWAAL